MFFVSPLWAVLGWSGMVLTALLGSVFIVVAVTVVLRDRSSRASRRSRAKMQALAAVSIPVLALIAIMVLPSKANSKRSSNSTLSNIEDGVREAIGAAKQTSGSAPPSSKTVMVVAAIDWGVLLWAVVEGCLLAYSPRSEQRIQLNEYGRKVMQDAALLWKKGERPLECDFVYNPHRGLPEFGIPPGVTLLELPETFGCPRCGQPKSRFIRQRAPDQPLDEKCRKCRKPLKPRKNFCGACGTRTSYVSHHYM